MRAAFRPGFTIVNYEYDNPSSGGQIIVTPGEEGVLYTDPETGRMYMYMDGIDGKGWYYMDNAGNLVYDPQQDGSGLVPVS